ncbi:hypothetical protein PSAC2689_130083 [Paraburkholderia sacchari]
MRRSGIAPAVVTLNEAGSRKRAGFVASGPAIGFIFQAMGYPTVARSEWFAQGRQTFPLCPSPPSSLLH